MGSAVAVENRFMNKDKLLSFHEADTANQKMARFMGRIRRDELVFCHTRKNFALLYDNVYDQHLLARFTIYKGQYDVSNVFRLRADVFWRDDGHHTVERYLKFHLDVNNLYFTADGIGNFTYWPSDIIRTHSSAYEDYNMKYDDERFVELRRQNVSLGILTCIHPAHYIAWGTKGYIL